MTFTAFPTAVFAVGDAVLYTETTVSSASSGDSFSYSVYLSGTYDGYAIMVAKNRNGIKVTDIKPESGVDVTDFGDVWMISVIGGLERKNSPKTKLATVSVYVESSANGAVKLGFDEDTVITNESGRDAVWLENLAVISVRKAVSGKRGDINSDGKINTKDAVLLAQYLAKWDVALNMNAADCNGDGAVEVKDAVLLAQYLALWNVTLG